MTKQRKKSKPAGKWGRGGREILEFPPGAMEKAIGEKQAEEERIAKRTNPKGVPVIFPPYE